MNENYYCSHEKRVCGRGFCCVVYGGKETGCFYCHRKWETPKQFKERTWREWRGAVYIRNNMTSARKKWIVYSKYQFEKFLENTYIPESGMDVICANTDFGPPPDDWTPEESE